MFSATSVLGRAVPMIVLTVGLSTGLCAQSIDNRQIYMLVNGIADDVELIREVMGRPYDDSPRLPASEVSRLELFFQSRALFGKANQLAQEFGVAEARSAPPAPDGALEPSHVFDVLEAAADQIGLVKTELGIETALEPLRRESSISDTGIFMTIIDVNRQLNLLVERPVTPRDVFDQIALVNTFAAGITEHLAPGSASPALPDPGGHRTPADIYAKLLECLDLVSRIAARVEGAEVMSLSSRRNIPDDIEPGHVHDIAVILVADVATLATVLDAGGLSLELPEPERVFPTEAYQRAALLEQQLIEIDRLL